MTITIVQSKAVTDAASGSFTTPTTAGNTVVVVLGTGNASNVTQTVSGITLGGSAGNFAQAVAVQSAFKTGTGTASAMIWGDPNCAGGQTAIAISGSNLNLVASSGNGWVAYEVNGLLSTSTLSVMLDKTATSSAITGTAVTSGTTGTTTQASEIALAVLIAFNTLSTFTGGFTTTAINDGSGEFGGGGSQVLSSTGTVTYGATAASSTVWAGAVVTLKGPASAHPAAAALTGTGTLTAGAVVTQPAAAALAGTGTLTAAPAVAIPSAAVLLGTGTLTAGAVVAAPGAVSAALSGTGVLTVAGGLGWSAAASLNGTGTLTAGWTGLMLQAAALSGTGVLTVAGTAALKFAAGLFGAGFLSIPQVAGGLVSGVGGAGTPMALPGSSQVAVAPPGSSNWQWLGTLGQVTALTYSYVCPGGADKMTMTILCPASYRTQLFNPGWQVKITRGGHDVWHGKLDEPQPSASGWTLTAVGNGNRGTDYLAVYSGTWPSGEPDAAVNAAITRGLPWGNPGIGTPSGIWLGQSVDSGAQTITGLLNLVTSRGGLTWYVNSQPGGLYATDDLSVFPLPTVPNRLLVATTPVGRTLGGDTNTVFVRYQVSSDNATTGTAATFSTVTAVNSQSVAAHGTIETYIDISDGGTLTSGAAQAIGAAALQLYQRASFAGPFQASYGQLLNMGGAPVDPGCDQAGNVVKMLLYDYGLGGEVTAGPIQWIIGSYSWDDFRQVATISPMQVLDQSLSGLLSAANNALTPITVAST